MLCKRVASYISPLILTALVSLCLSCLCGAWDRPWLVDLQLLSRMYILIPYTNGIIMYSHIPLFGVGANVSNT